MFTEPGSICSALPVSPLCTHHKTQIHRSGAWNDRTTTSEQHRINVPLQEKTYEDRQRVKEACECPDQEKEVILWRG